MFGFTLQINVSFDFSLVCQRLITPKFVWEFIQFVVGVAGVILTLVQLQ